MDHSRSKNPFFHDVETHHLIEQIADSSVLTIFAGAGVTIDRTGLAWRALLDGLLKKAEIDKHELEAIESYVVGRSEMQYASIVRAIYERKGDEWRRILSEAIHTLLYSERTWRGGRYAGAIAELVVAMHQAGRAAFILTTNHDEFIEMALRASALRHGLDVDVTTLSLEMIEQKKSKKRAEASEGWPESIAVIHVHGGIRKKRRRDGKIGSVVLGEYDFFDYERAVAKIASEMMLRSNVLLVGVGMDDPNLLRALHHVKRLSASGHAETLSGRRTWAVLTKAGLSPKGVIDEELVDRARVAIEKRLGEFDVRPVLPDTYAQAHQLLLEVAQEVKHSSEGRRYSDDDATYRYGKRLRAWWDAWNSSSTRQRAGVTALEARRLKTQGEHHLILESAALRVREILEDNQTAIRRSDHVKVEVWLRWNPTDANRVLRQWCSSLGPWVTEASFKEDPISSASPLAATRAFSSGAAELVEHNGQRWPRYLAVPIQVATADHQSVIVGVVCVAAGRTELLSWEKVKPMRQLVEELPRLVADVVEVAGFAVAPAVFPAD
jgi:hypothetical protein